MKKELILLASMVFWGIYAQAQTPNTLPPANVKKDPNEIFNGVHEEPEFNGGSRALERFVKENTKYPETAREKKIRGGVAVKFVVEKDGSISNIQTIYKLPNCPECDAEAIRLIKAMPKWEAGKQNGNAVRVMHHLPIKFILSR